MIDLTRLNYRIRNCVLSQHGTDHLADCNQCGMKPKRMWSHSGAVIGCECSVLTNANGAGWGTLEHSWQILQGACTEADELRTNLAKAHEDHNLYRAEMRARLEASKDGVLSAEQIKKMLDITYKINQRSVS